MEKFIGVKVIKAGPEMSKKEYCEYRGWKVPEGEDTNEKVYLVEYEPDQDSKPNHPNHIGYISMSPKSVFEKAYKALKLVIPNVEGLQTHQERVVIEATELQHKCKLLEVFINGNVIFNNLNVDEQDRLKQQLIGMKYYLTILIERIENF